MVLQMLNLSRGKWRQIHLIAFKKMFIKNEVLLKAYTCLPMLRFHNNWQNLGNHLQGILGKAEWQGWKKCKQSLVRQEEMSVLSQEKWKKCQLRRISSIMGKSLDLLYKLLLYWHLLDSIKIDSTMNGGDCSSPDRFCSCCSYVP